MATIQIKAEVSGSVWKIITAVGETIEPGGTLMILESMKMEIPVIAEDGGTVQKFTVAETEAINEGQVVAVLST
ncbi:MAG: biotin/lipoyl-binding carrier protein [Reyranella sp.]|nr:biotin/lipoyl-binding carrier protein [Hylemonella sp.]MDP3162108.1 biotin/lipoyl-binding carrier protein [Reyranella sp.]